MIGLFGNSVPKSVQNFAELCSGVNGVSRYSGRPLHYKGNRFHKIVKGFMAQAGDITFGDGTGGESIFHGDIIK